MTDGNWRALLRDASQLRAAGRVPEAIDAYRQVLRINPDLPDSWFNLGWLQRQTRAFEDALRSYQKALEHRIAKPEDVHLNRAAIYSEYLHRPRDAEEALKAAIKANPSHIPALISLGNLHEDLGEREAARDAYSKAFELDPSNARPLVRLAMLSLSSNLDEQLAAQLRARIDDPMATNTQRAGLGYALAAMLDAAGQYDDAFAVGARANDASRAAAGSRGHYDRSAHEQLVDRLISTFDRRVAGDAAGAAPVFICGMFRSGSTLIEQLLAGHGGVAPGGELDLIPIVVRSVPNYPEPFANADASVFARARDFYLAGLPEQPGVKVVTDKRPDNFLHIGLIKSIFPNAKIIHTVRNPLDNLLSLYFLHLDSEMSYAMDLDDAAHWYAQYRKLMRHWEQLYGEDIFEIDYDTLVHDPEPVVRSLLQFLKLDWEDSVLDFSDTDRPVKTASVWQVREPIYARSSGRWRNYEAQLEQLRTALGEAGISTDE